MYEKTWDYLSTELGYIKPTETLFDTSPEKSWKKRKISMEMSDHVSSTSLATSVTGNPKRCVAILYQPPTTTSFSSLSSDSTKTTAERNIITNLAEEVLQLRVNNNELQQKMLWLEAKLSKLEEAQQDDEVDGNLRNLPLGPVQLHPPVQPDHGDRPLVNQEHVDRPLVCRDIIVRTHRTDVTVKDVPSLYTLFHCSYLSRLMNHSKYHQKFVQKNKKMGKYTGTPFGK